MPKAGRQVQSLDTEALSKFGKEEASSLNGALSLCFSLKPQTSVARGQGRRLLGRGWVVLFLLAPTGLADTADYTWGSQEQQG